MSTIMLITSMVVAGIGFYLIILGSYQPAIAVLLLSIAIGIYSVVITLDDYFRKK